LKIPRYPQSLFADHYLTISIYVDFSLHRLTFLTIPGESKKICSKIHAGSEGFSESMDRYVKPHGGLRIANYGDVVTFLGYGKVCPMAGMELRSPAVIEVAKQRLTRLVGKKVSVKNLIWDKATYYM